MKKLLLVLVLSLSGCATFQFSTLNHDPIYDTVLVVPEGTQIDTLNSRQLQWKLRTDFNFRYDFAQYALSQPQSFDWKFNRMNRFMGFNRYGWNSGYYNNSWGYSNMWNRSQMWNDWVWGYPYGNGMGWSSWNNYGMYGYGNYHNWNNGYGYNNGFYNRYRGTNVAYHTGRRMSPSDRRGIGAMGNSRIATNIQNNRVVINSKPRINVEETKLQKIVTNLRRKIINPNIKNVNNRIIPIKNNNNNNSKPRIYVRPNNNSNNNNPPRIYNRPPVNNSNTSTNASSNVSRGSNNSRGGKSNIKN
jgi:hypothetical protein